MWPDSTFLFARSGFVTGAGSALDLGGTLAEYNRALTPEQADALALWADWLAVGGDLRAAVERYVRSLAPVNANARPAN